jgi:hypothetical protein
MPRTAAPGNPPTIGLKYDSGTGIITTMLRTPSSPEATIAALARRP